MRLTRTRPADEEPTIVDALKALPRVGCDDPEHHERLAELEVVRAERDQAAAERDAAQAQLARHLAAPAVLPSLGITWDEPMPEGTTGLLNDWPDVPGDKAEGVPERIEVSGD